MIYLRRYNHSHAVIFDKTGTLTLGQPKVVEIVTAKDGISENQLLHLVASVEQRSEHPMVQAILEKASETSERRILTVNVAKFNAITGHGVIARSDESFYLVS